MFIGSIPVIFLHGFGHDRDQYELMDYTIENLSEGEVACIRLNNPGTGDEPPLADKTLRGYFDWLDAKISITLREFNVDKVFLVGCSSANTLISEYVNARTNNGVAGIFMIEPVVRSKIRQCAYSLLPGFARIASKFVPHSTIANFYFLKGLKYNFNLGSALLDLKIHCMTTKPVMTLPVGMIAYGSKFRSLEFWQLKKMMTHAKKNCQHLVSTDISVDLASWAHTAQLIINLVYSR